MGDLDSKGFEDIQKYVEDKWKLTPLTAEYGTLEESFGPNGKVTNVFRQAVATGKKCCVYLHGSLSNPPVNLEPLNTVLDDNRCMVFNNGERLDLKNVCVVCLLTEKNVEESTPAFVSRTGWVVL